MSILYRYWILSYIGLTLKGFKDNIPIIIGSFM